MEEFDINSLKILSDSSTNENESNLPIIPSEQEEKEDPLVSDDDSDFEEYDDDDDEYESKQAQKNADSVSKSAFEKFEEKNNRRKKIRIISTIVISALLVLGIVISFTIFFFKISDVSISGNSRYDNSDIINCSGITYGSNIYSIDKEEIQRSIIESCPYIKSVRVYRNLPSTLLLEIEEEIPSYYFEIADEFFVLSDSLRILERTKSMGELLLDYPNIVKLNTQTIKKAIVGEKLVFENEGYISYAEEMLSIFKKSSIYEHISSIDFSDQFTIFVIYENKYKIVLGDISDVENKVNIVQEIIATLDPSDKGVINVEGDPAFFLLGASITD